MRWRINFEDDITVYVLAILFYTREASAPTSRCGGGRETAMMAPPRHAESEASVHHCRLATIAGSACSTNRLSLARSTRILNRDSTTNADHVLLTIDSDLHRGQTSRNGCD